MGCRNHEKTYKTLYYHEACNQKIKFHRVTTEDGLPVYRGCVVKQKNDSVHNNPETRGHCISTGQEAEIVTAGIETTGGAI